MAKEKAASSKPNNPDDLFSQFLAEKNKLATSIAESILNKLREEQKPEIAMIEVYLQSFQEAMKNAGLVLNQHYEEADEETRTLIKDHINNTSILSLTSSTNALLKKKGISGFLGKILPIIEVIKKILKHITDLFPNFLSNLIKKILLPILELIDNLIKIILGASGINATFLRQAEEDFLTTHPLWRRLQYEPFQIDSAE